METQPHRGISAGHPTKAVRLVLLPLPVVTGLFATTIGTRWAVPPARSTASMIREATIDPVDRDLFFATDDPDVAVHHVRTRLSG